ncbi:hypothetical protein AKJ09_06827 [Labilithrix luteola]|uniref:IgGFc-binding protein N-terminal domain-containing protein n=1 Tax=Labilithrix luteola TaxID=1391654 RepID=A0A0K1Q311_9BACT|nr:hypothetical protein AKJ09_06827 [Labilithrix luteola]
MACSSRAGFDPREEVLLPPDGSAPETSAPTCGIHCSRDLKQVLDGCEGAETVVATCNADEGCGDGKCVDACSAATLSKGSAGCDFWTVYPDSPGESRGSCFAVLVANTWDRNVTIAAEHGSDTLDISKSTYVIDWGGHAPTYTPLEGPLPPGKIAGVFLSYDAASSSPHKVSCPAAVTPALLQDPMKYGTVKTKAFRIRTDAPVAAYSVAPYGGFESFEPTATLLLPTSSWTKNYIAVSPFDFGETRKPRTLQIIANEDGTEITMRPTVDVRAGVDIASAPAGTTQTWSLDRGQVLQFYQSSLTGTPIEATKPIAVFGGSHCDFLPVMYCDMLQQQIPPFAQWGTEYAVVPYQPRIPSVGADTTSARELVPYTIVGAVDDTVLTYEPSRPRDAPETLKSNESVSFMTDQLFVVKSQDSKHPFHVSTYMTGATFGGGVPGNVTLGDPDFVNVPPTDQYLDRYIFLADFTFPDTMLTIVRKATTKGFAPVELECAGEVTDFSPLGTSGKYEFAWVKITEGFVPQQFAKGTCGYGRHEVHSDGPFSVSVWGVGPYSSYGFVGGMGLRPIHTAPPPTVR